MNIDKYKWVPQVGEVVGEAGVVHVVLQFPVEAAHITRDPGEELQAAWPMRGEY